MPLEIPYSVVLQLQHLVVGMPDSAWWLPVLILLLLGVSALIDSFTSEVPEPIIFLGLGVTVAAQGIYVSWPFAATNLSLGILAALLVWGVNWVWHFWFRHDALGMGDAKWSMLMIACFGYAPALIAWGVGACLAILWMMGAKLTRMAIVHVHFAPFLFLGLLFGLYWLRLRA